MIQNYMTDALHWSIGERRASKDREEAAMFGREVACWPASAEVPLPERTLGSFLEAQAGLSWPQRVVRVKSQCMVGLRSMRMKASGVGARYPRALSGRSMM